MWLTDIEVPESYFSWLGDKSSLTHKPFLVFCHVYAMHLSSLACLHLLELSQLTHVEYFISIGIKLFEMFRSLHNILIYTVLVVFLMKELLKVYG